MAGNILLNGNNALTVPEKEVLRKEGERLPSSARIGLLFGSALAGLLIGLSFASLPELGRSYHVTPFRILGGIVGGCTLATAIGLLFWRCHNKKSMDILVASFPTKESEKEIEQDGEDI